MIRFIKVRSVLPGCVLVALACLSISFLNSFIRLYTIFFLFNRQLPYRTGTVYFFSPSLVSCLVCSTCSRIQLYLDHVYGVNTLLAVMA